MTQQFFTGMHVWGHLAVRYCTNWRHLAACYSTEEAAPVKIISKRWLFCHDE
jgi:hypothetical protein